MPADVGPDREKLGVIESQRGRRRSRSAGWTSRRGGRGRGPTYAAIIAESRARHRARPAAHEGWRCSRRRPGCGRPPPAARRAARRAGRRAGRAAFAAGAQEQTRFAVRLLDSAGVPLRRPRRSCGRPADPADGRGRPGGGEARGGRRAVPPARRASWADPEPTWSRSSLGCGRQQPGRTARPAAGHRRPAAQRDAGRGRAGVAGRGRWPRRRPAGAGARGWKRARALSRGAPVRSGCAAGRAGALVGRWPAIDAEVLKHSRAGLARPGQARAALASPRAAGAGLRQASRWGRSGWPALVRSGSPTQVLEWMERTRAARCPRSSRPTPRGRGRGARRHAGVQAELRAHDLGTGIRSAEFRRAELWHRQAEAGSEDPAGVVDRTGAGPGGSPQPRLSTATLRQRLGGRCWSSMTCWTRADRRGGSSRGGPGWCGWPGRGRPVRDQLGARSRCAGWPGAAARRGRRGQPRRRCGRPGWAWPRSPECDRLDAAGRHRRAGRGAVVAAAGAVVRDARRAGVDRAGRGDVGAVARQPAARRRARARRRPDVPAGSGRLELLAGLYPDAVVLRPPESTAGAVTAALAGAGLPTGLPTAGPLRQPDLLLAAAVRRAATVHELELRGTGASAPRD